MVRSMFIAAGLCIVASPVLASHCSQPFAPDTKAATSKDAVVQLRQDVQAFLTASDVYQQCLIDQENSDPSFKAQADKLVEANQADKQRVGDAFNAIAKQFSSGAVASR